MFRRPLALLNRLGGFRIHAQARLTDNPLFSYTSGRWIYQEEDRLRERHIPFNVEALEAAAVSSVNGARSVTSISKLAEGASSRVFSLALDNGAEVIARIPFAHAGPAHFMTSSEVATMEYVSRLHVPVPQVLVWCSHKDATPVGTEFIIMEKAPGVPLHEVWATLTHQQRRELSVMIAKMENTLLSASFPGSGSIFFPKDLDEWVAKGGQPLPLAQGDGQFVLGPSLEQNFWQDERGDMSIDRGPWKDPVSYLAAIARRERAWIIQFSEANPVDLFRSYPPSIRDPAAHVHLLDLLLSVLSHLQPPRPGILRPSLWHRDLHAPNIFIAPEELANGKVVITSVLDWQSTSVAPLFSQARIPRVLRYGNGEVKSFPRGPDATALPEDFDTMTAEQQIEAEENIRAIEIQRDYEAYHTVHSPDCAALFSEDESFLFAKLYRTTNYLWGQRFIGLRDSLMELQYRWPRMASLQPCPLSFTVDDRRQHLNEAMLWQDREDIASLLMQGLGVGPQGWVPSEEYEDAKRNNILVRAGFKEQMTEEECPGKDEMYDNWPFIER